MCLSQKTGGMNMPAPQPRKDRTIDATRAFVPRTRCKTFCSRRRFVGALTADAVLLSRLPDSDRPPDVEDDGAPGAHDGSTTDRSDRLALCAAPDEAQATLLVRGGQASGIGEADALGEASGFLLLR